MDLDSLTLRKTKASDLEHLFEFQKDEIGVQMAAFTAEDPSDRDAYMTKWRKIIVNEEICMQTICLEEQILGSIVSFPMGGDLEVSYWLDRPCWGNGVATNALRQFLEIMKDRPLHGRVAADNLGSIRVLEKCGFERIGKEKGFANARGKEIEEFVYILK